MQLLYLNQPQNTAIPVFPQRTPHNTELIPIGTFTRVVDDETLQSRHRLPACVKCPNLKPTVTSTSKQAPQVAECV